MTVKRYTPTQCCEHDGTYVTYSDYQKLVAENVAVKKYAKIDDYDKCDNCGFESYVMPIETPNTDTFTAELSAQGVGEFAADMWKRGNELVAEGAQKSLVVQVRLAAKLADTYAANLRAGRKG